MRKNLVAGNWKMNMTYQDGLALVSEITQHGGRRGHRLVRR